MATNKFVEFKVGIRKELIRVKCGEFKVFRKRNEMVVL